jgi:hypothetical protein
MAVPSAANSVTALPKEIDGLSSDVTAVAKEASGETREGTAPVREYRSMTKHWDVFLSYARTDAAQVHRLAENLHNVGLEVFLDEWQIAPGDVLVHQLDQEPGDASGQHTKP